MGLGLSGIGLGLLISQQDTDRALAHCLMLDPHINRPTNFEMGQQWNIGYILPAEYVRGGVESGPARAMRELGSSSPSTPNSFM